MLWCPRRRASDGAGSDPVGPAGSALADLLLASFIRRETVGASATGAPTASATTAALGSTRRRSTSTAFCRATSTSPVPAAAVSWARTARWSSRSSIRPLAAGFRLQGRQVKFNSVPDFCPAAALGVARSCRTQPGSTRTPDLTPHPDGQRRTSPSGSARTPSSIRTSPKFR